MGSKTPSVCGAGFIVDFKINLKQEGGALPDDNAPSAARSATNQVLPNCLNCFSVSYDIFGGQKFCIHSLPLAKMGMTLSEASYVNPSLKTPYARDMTPKKMSGNLAGPSSKREGRLRRLVFIVVSVFEKIEKKERDQGARKKTWVDRIVLLADTGFRIYLPTSRAPRATHFNRRNPNLVTSILFAPKSSISLS